MGQNMVVLFLYDYRKINNLENYRKNTSIIIVIFVLKFMIQRITYYKVP